MFGLLLVVVLLWKANASSGRCESLSVKHGEQGEILFFFNEPLNLENVTKFLLHVQFSGAKGDIFRCTAPVLNCTVWDNRFKFGRLYSHNLTLQIPEASFQLQGRYTMLITKNGVYSPTFACNLTVLPTVLPPDDADSKPGGIQTGELAAIVLVSIAASILVTALIAYASIRNRKRLRNFFRRNKRSIKREEQGTTGDQGNIKDGSSHIRYRERLRNFFRRRNSSMKREKQGTTGDQGDIEDGSSHARPVSTVNYSSINRSSSQGQLYQKIETAEKENLQTMDSGYSSTQQSMSSGPRAQTSAGSITLDRGSAGYQAVPQDETN